MSNFIGQAMASVGKPGDIDAAARNPLGMVVRDDAGNSFVYLEGVAATVIGSCVTYGVGATPFQTALSVTGARGPVAIATAAVLAGQFGWYQNGGIAQALFNAAAAAGAVLYSASTGKVDDASVSGDLINGAICAVVVASGVLGSAYLDHPFMGGAA